MKGSETEVSTFKPRETVTLQAPYSERFMYVQRWAKNCFFSFFFFFRGIVPLVLNIDPCRHDETGGPGGEFKIRVS